MMKRTMHTLRGWRLAGCTALTLGGLPLAAQAATAVTFYVVPSGTGPGDGTSANPFVLTHGREFDLTAALQPLLKAGDNVTVSLASGTYTNVELLIYRQGANHALTTIYPQTVINGVYTGTWGRTGLTCDGTAPNQNTCRVQAADYAFTSDAGQGTLLIESATPDGAILDGTGLRDSPEATANAWADGVDIQTGLFETLANPDQPYTTTDPRISGVTIRGIIFKDWRNGGAVGYSYGITFDGDEFINIGDRIGRTIAHDGYMGTGGLNINNDARYTVVENGLFANIYNVAGAQTSDNAQDDAGLIHGIYLGHSRDAIVYNNTFQSISSEAIKDGNYPTHNKDGTVYQYPSSPIGDRRQFFVQNHIILRTIVDDYGTQPEVPTQGFFHDIGRFNSDGDDGPPASCVILLNNNLDNRYPTTSGIPVSVIRQELNNDGMTTSLPGWYADGNVMEGVSTGDLVVDRVSGDDSNFVEVTSQDSGYVASLNLVAQDGTSTVAAAVNSDAQALISGQCKSDSSTEDHDVSVWFSNNFTN